MTAPDGAALFKALEPVVIFAAIGGVLVWQWLSVRAEIRRDRQKAEALGRAQAEQAGDR